MHRRRSGGAGVLDPRRRLEAQLRIGLQHQRGGKILRREAGVEMPEHDLVDIGGGNAGVRQRFVGDADHEALDGLGIELAERRMRPSDDAGCHGRSPCLCFGSLFSLSGGILHAGLSDFIARSHMAVMPSQLPDLISAAGHSQEPPTATTFRSASHDAALASPIPPVGQNRASGKGPANARSALMPPDCSAGKNLTRPKPCASACISSDAVAIPGANGKALAAAAFSRSGVAPGLMPNFTPSASRAIQIVGVQDGADADDGVRHLGHDRLGGLDRHRRAQRDFQHAHTARDQRLGERHRVFEPFDGEHRDDAGRLEQRGEFFLLSGRFTIMRKPCERLPGSAQYVAGIAERGMIAPG